MSTLTPLTGYEINIGHYNPRRDFRLIKTIPLKVNSLGGAHITNKEDLISLIEDAIFNNEKEENSK
jgi:hypothetical protein